MTTMNQQAAQPQGRAFRLSMLIYDTRYRSMTIQIVALVGFLVLLGWLASNVAHNFASLGKDLQFNFLFERSGYDINQRLLQYTSDDTHLRAAFLGLLNTLLVAFLGCTTATILGVFIGVMRLSKNWLVARLMTIYVETFRNVPVLLWIVFIMAILINVFPEPRAFRGENATAHMSILGSTAFTNRGIYVPEPLFSNGLGNWHLFGESSLRFDVSKELILILIVLGISIYGARRIAAWAVKVQNATGDRPTTWYMTAGVLIVPTLIVLVALGFHFGYPEFKGFNFRGGIFLRNSLIALWLALSLYTAAFIAEIVRSGILAISKGQTEAASALGLRSGRTMSLVILPQAMRIIIPPLISQYLNLTKNSSLAIAVGYMDITGTLMGITLNQTGREFETVLLTMLIFLTISLSISSVMNWYNNRVKLVER